MQFKTIENTKVANDILVNLSTIHTKNRYSNYSLKGLCHAYTTLRSKTTHKFFDNFTEKELNLFMKSYNNYIKNDYEDPKTFQILLFKPSSVKEILQIKATWRKRKEKKYSPLMDLDAIWVSKSEITSYLKEDYCIYLIRNSLYRIEKEIDYIGELIPFTLMTLREASERWGLGESTIRGLIHRSKTLKENIDYRKSGNTYLITEHSMKKHYGEPIKNVK